MQLHSLHPKSYSGNERALPMSQVRSMAITCACMLSCFPGPAAAGDDILVARKDCAYGVHLVVRGAPLADVLTRLSEALGFQLQLLGSSDSTVHADLSGQAPELLTKLSPLDSLIVTRAADPQCPGRYRVVKVWMLPKGGPGPSRLASAPPAPRQLTEAEKREIQQREDAYRTAHGVPPAPPQDDASK